MASTEVTGDRPNYFYVSRSCSWLTSGSHLATRASAAPPLGDDDDDDDDDDVLTVLELLNGIITNNQA
jgi:hypothetical protein